MKIVTLIARLLLGLICVVLGLNGLLNFLSMGAMPTGPAGQGIVARQEKSYAESDKNVRYALWQTKAQRRQAMSYSISTLLTRNLHDVFGENDPARRRAAIDEIFTKIACSTNLTGASTVGATRSIASRARSGVFTQTLDISQLPSPRNWAMPGGSNG